MVSCCIADCHNRSSRKTKNQLKKEKKARISFHRFPVDAALYQAWIDAIQRKDWKPDRRSVVCSEHFEKNCFEVSAFCKKLSKAAVPTIFPIIYYTEHVNEIQNERDPLLISSTEEPYTSTTSLAISDESVDYKDEKLSRVAVPTTVPIICHIQPVNEPQDEREPLLISSTEEPYTSTTSLAISDESVDYKDEKLSRVAVPTTFPTICNIQPVNEPQDERDPLLLNCTEKPSTLNTSLPISDESIDYKDKSEEYAPISEIITTWPMSPSRSILIDKYEHKLSVYRKKIRALEQKARRQKNKIEKLQIALKELESKKLINEF